MYIISRCLLGHECKYNGGSNRNEELIEFCKNHDYITVCPEEAGGLPTPRQPAEIVYDDEGSRVQMKTGEDVTAEFEYGASLSVASVLTEAGFRPDHRGIIEGAILKANSPSCGAGAIYDGTFTGTLTGGNGVFADRLIEAVLAERNDEFRSDGNRLFADTFKITNEDNFIRVFGDK